MPLPFETAYQSSHGCVTWEGRLASEGQGLHAFLITSVSSRLNDSIASEEMRRLLRGLSLTGMGQSALEEVLAAEVPEQREWAAGEALAEAVLEEQYNVILPWNTERDKRNPFASLPGADIVGLQRDGASHRLAFGEVKCSSEAKCPPQVMSGRSGAIGHQIDSLANNLGVINQLIKWLLPRIKGTEHEEAFAEACTRYFNSLRLDVALFGVLVRDQAVRERDLLARGQSLGNQLQTPTVCCLLGLYLPWPISDLVDAIYAGGSA